MSYQALARKWRPRGFEAVVGQEHVVRALVNALEGDRLHHAYLFSGTRGVGKTTIARILAKCLNCDAGPTAHACGECGACREIDEGRHVDLLEVDAASRARVDETRELLGNVEYAPDRARFKVYLIDEVHMFSRHSFNALLKTLEEPPPHVKFLLATTDPQRLPVTVLSRCLQLGLRRLEVSEISEELARICTAETIEAEPEALRVIARAADGSMRDALSLLDQSAAYGAGRIGSSDVRSLLGTVAEGRLHAILEALAAGDSAAMVEAVDSLAAEAADFEVVLGEVVDALGRIAVLQAVPESGAMHHDGDAELGRFAERIDAEALQLHYQIGLMGRRDLPLAPHPRGGFEMTMLRMVAFAPTGVGAPARTDGGEPAPTPAPRAQAPVRASLPAEEGGPGDAAPAAEPAPRAPRGLVPSEWPEVCQRLALNGMAGALAANCVLRGYDDGVVDLALSPGRAQLLNPSTREALRAALGAYLGVPVRVEIDVVDPEREAPADRRAREEREKVERTIVALREVPDVQDMFERLDGEIDTGSVQPRS